MDDKGKKKEYNRNYYYKRDPNKLKQYRKDYLKRKRNKEATERWNNSEKGKSYLRIWYEHNKDRITEEYRVKKLKEFVDKTITHIDNLPQTEMEAKKRLKIWTDEINKTTAKK